MAQSEARELEPPGMRRWWWRVLYAIKLAVAALLATGVAFGISYALRRLNY